MKKLELEPFSLRLRTPVRAAWGTLERRELLRLLTKACDGLSA